MIRISSFSRALVGLLTLGWYLVASLSFGQDLVDEKDREDRVNLFWDKVRKGEVKFDAEASPKLVLEQILKGLNIPVSSQVLLYSKTSLQNFGIHPKTPRAIYFNEHAYVGFVQNGDFEVIAMDPIEGPQYYLIRRDKKTREPQLFRAYDCQSCHMDASSAIQVLSVKTNTQGFATSNDLNLLTTYQSPIDERWGGWYVTGKIQGQTHEGNWQNMTDRKDPIPVSNPNELNESELVKFLDVRPYLSPGSDILALMVLEHQGSMHNTLASSGMAVRRVMARANGEMDRPSVKRAAALHARKVLEQLLQLNDAGFDGEIEPSSTQFAEAFGKEAIRDPQKRSLRDFQYQGRLFKYRCSYMIYTRYFTELPEVLKAEIYTRLKKILMAPPGNDEFDHLTQEERIAIAEILQATHSEVKAAWDGK